MRIVAREDIDDVKWNRIVEDSKVQNFILYSWSMDATAENWCAIIDGDYDFILPIPFSVNLGVKRARQQVYSRQVDFIGNADLLTKALELLKSEFKEFSVRFSENKYGETDQHFQFLDLNNELSYSENAKRLIKKAGKFYRYEQTKDLKPLLSFYKENTHVKLNQPKENLDRLERLMIECIANNRGYAINVISDDQIVAAGFIIEDKSTAIYLIGDTGPEEKKKGAIYGLMDYSIQMAVLKKMNYFDFGGSNVESVARFYKKFGAKNQKYTRINWDVTPVWFRLLKKIKF